MTQGAKKTYSKIIKIPKNLLIQRERALSTKKDRQTSKIRLLKKTGRQVPWLLFKSKIITYHKTHNNSLLVKIMRKLVATSSHFRKITKSVITLVKLNSFAIKSLALFSQEKERSMQNKFPQANHQGKRDLIQAQQKSRNLKV